MIRDPSDGSVKQKHDGPICKECGIEFYYDFIQRPNDYTGYCENCVPSTRSAPPGQCSLPSGESGPPVMATAGGAGTGLASLQAKYGPNWGLRIEKHERKPKPAPTKEELESHYREFGLGFQKREQE